MEPQGKQLIHIAISLLCLTCLQCYGDVVYITAPEIFQELNIQNSIGTSEFPFTSISQTIYSLSEGQSHQIFLSPHIHQLQCLQCSDCPDNCEILRGGAVWKGEKSLTIQTFQNCSQQQANQAMCHKSQNKSELRVERQVKLEMINEGLAFNNLNISEEEDLINPNEEVQNQVWIQAQRSNILLEEVHIKL